MSRNSVVFASQLRELGKVHIGISFIVPFLGNREEAGGVRVSNYLK